MLRIMSLVAGLAVATGVLSAGTILSITDNPSFSSGVGLATIAFGWHQSSTFTNENISFVLVDATSGGPIAGVEATIYLMNLVGPAATAANELAAPVQISGLSGFTTVNPFTGLTLGPGNYWVVIAATTDSSASVQYSSGAAIEVVGSGVTDLGETAGTPVAFAPAFTPFGPPITPNFTLSVTGTAAVAGVPEPSTAAMTIGAIAVLGLLRRRLSGS
jgi:hypothetical protein